MTNVIRIKRSTTVVTPPSLEQGELAYSESTGTGSGELFIGIAGASLEKIGGFKDVTKLATIETNADVTDTANVAAAGAVMEADSTTSLMSFVIDEDTMLSDLATKVPTQQSVKAYVDNNVVSGMTYKGGYNASTNTPALDVTPIATKVGDTYTVTAAGAFFTTDVEVGDTLMSEVANATAEADWTIVQSNLTPAAIKTQYESNPNTNSYTNAEATKVAFIAVTQAVDLDTIESDTIANNAKVSDIPDNTVTNLSVGTITATNVPILSSDGSDIATLPAASATLAGIVTNGSQTFGGTKTFADISGNNAGATIDSFVIDGGTF